MKEWLWIKRKSWGVRNENENINDHFYSYRFAIGSGTVLLRLVITKSRER
jgi:hypothetical protein